MVFLLSKRRLGWNENKFKNYLKEGRGQGIGKDYKPWITIQDFPSKGRSSRTPGWKSHRVHHFFSDNELRYFYLLEWSDIVVDIREQFPLLEIDDAINIAENMGVKYPREPESQYPYTLTTDFMITLNVGGKEIHIARSVKPSTELDKKRVLEKLEIERRYWADRNIDWGIVTEKEIPLAFTKNIEWIYTAYRLNPAEEMKIKELVDLSSILKHKLQQRHEISIRQITSSLDKEMNLEIGTSLYVFRHLVARKEIIMDMEQKLDVSMPASTIERILDNHYGEIIA